MMIKHNYLYQRASNSGNLYTVGVTTEINPSGEMWIKAEFSMMEIVEHCGFEMLDDLIRDMSTYHIGIGYPPRHKGNYGAHVTPTNKGGMYVYVMETDVEYMCQEDIDKNSKIHRVDKHLPGTAYYIPSEDMLRILYALLAEDKICASLAYIPVMR